MLHAPHFSRRATNASLTILAALSLGACASAASAPKFVPPTRPAQFSMTGVAWQVGRDSLTALLEDRGYNYNSTDKDGDMWFDGVLLGTPARLFAFMAGDSLVKMRIRLVTADEDALPVYAKARAELLKLYGAPSESAREFAAPYAKGGNEEAAVKQGKAKINTHWLIGTGRRQSHVAIEVQRDLVVVIDYEGPGWNREYLKRRNSAD